MHYDFVDIGTCDFDIADNLFLANKKYLMIEPVKFYFDKLPNHSNIVKLNAALSNYSGYVDIFFVKEEDIIRYNLPFWVRGCNSINKKHPTVVKLLNDLELPDLITFEKVPVFTFKNLIDLYDITSITQLKIDTEGHDHIILSSVKEFLAYNNISIETIKVEYILAFENTKEIDIIRNNLKQIYPNQKILGDDLYLSKI